MEKLKYFTRILFAAILLSVTGLKSADEICLVRDAKAEAAIVIPDNAIPCEKMAAEELRYHVEKASGAKLPVYDEKNLQPGMKHYIYIGNCRKTAEAGIKAAELSPSEYVIRTTGKNMFIAGRDRDVGYVGDTWYAAWQGTLFGVYDLLENELGVRWLWPGKVGEYIPQSRTIICSGRERTGKPEFISTRLMQSGRKYPLEGWASQEHKDKFYAEEQTFLLRHRFAAIQNMNYCHNFSNYWKRFGKTHPEYFSLSPDGKREPLAGDKTGMFTSLCVSQPALWKQIAVDWKYLPRELKKVRPFVCAMPNDTPGMCTCKACRSWDAADPDFAASDYWGKGIPLDNFNKWTIASAAWGEDSASANNVPSLSDRYAKFYLNVLNEAKKIQPDAKLIGFAYANYTEPPKNVKLNEDIIISNVFPLWFPYTRKMSDAFRANWMGWRKTGAVLHFRPNLLHAGANLPIFYARQFAADFAFAAQHGMISSDMDALLGAWSNQGPTLYTVVRIHEHPEWSSDKILDEYYSCFGKAQNEVKKYFEYWELHSNAITSDQAGRYCNEERDSRGRCGGGFQNYVLIAHRLFTPANFAAARQLLNAARKSAQGDDLTELRIAFLEKGLTDAELTTAVRSAQANAQKNPSAENKRAFAEAFKKMAEHRNMVETDNVGNFGIYAFRERTGAGWPWKVKTNK